MPRSFAQSSSTPRRGASRRGGVPISQKKEHTMKAKTILLVVAFCMSVAAATFAADNPNLGTWKLNESKSKIPAGAAKNAMVVYTAEGDSYKCVVDGTDASGAASHNEWTGKFDGKDYAVTGDPTADTRSIKMVDARHFKLANKKAGKTTATGTIEFSADGKTRTLTVHSTNPAGKKITATTVYDKQ
jgi:hypothetical protein